MMPAVKIRPCWFDSMTSGEFACKGYVMGVDRSDKRGLFLREITYRIMDDFGEYERAVREGVLSGSDLAVMKKLCCDAAVQAEEELLAHKSPGLSPEAVAILGGAYAVHRDVRAGGSKYRDRFDNALRTLQQVRMVEGRNEEIRRCAVECPKAELFARMCATQMLDGTAPGCYVHWLTPENAKRFGAEYQSYVERQARRVKAEPFRASDMTALERDLRSVLMYGRESESCYFLDG